jgi:hypothetical protein
MDLRARGRRNAEEERDWEEADRIKACWFHAHGKVQQWCIGKNSTAGARLRSPANSTLCSNSTQQHLATARALWIPIVQLQLRGEKKGRAVAVGGAGGLLHFLWPEGRREVAETAQVLPAGGVHGILGPSLSRVWCPSADDDATAAAAAARRDKSSRTLPRPNGAPLRRQRRVRGGGAPMVELVGGNRKFG